MSDASITDILVDHKKDNREVIIAHLISEPGVVELNDEQKKLLERWECADNLIRSNRYKTTEIVKILEKKFDIGHATAWRYVNSARYVFGSSMQSNKKYLLAVHADRIENFMQIALKQGDLKSLAALSKEYTNAVVSMPEDSKGRTAAPMPVFMIQQNSINILMETPITANDAAEIARKKLTAEGIEFTDI